MFKQLAVIGCGLMGGSFALAMKHHGLVQRVVGFSPSRSSTDAALRLGVIDACADTPAAAVTGADIVLIAVPVAASEPVLAALRDTAEPDALLMDVGSTKGDVVAAAQRALGNRIGRFVPAHPIAGKASSGVQHAQASLYAGCQVVITPLPANPPALVERACRTWQALGARVVTMTPAAHDAAMAAVSHLPHLIAFAYLNNLLAQADGAQSMALGGPGFRDFTRIAASDTTMWRDVLLANREQVLRQSQAFRQALLALETAIEEGDGQAVHRSIQQASAARAQWRSATDDSAP